MAIQLSGHTCAFCLAPKLALKFDKKGRPYVSCAGCNLRAFLGDIRNAIRYLACIEPIARAKAKAIYASDEEAMQLAKAEAILMRAFMTSRGELWTGGGGEVSHGVAAGGSVR